MLNFNLQLRDHMVSPIPLNTPVLVFQKTSSDTNVCLIFGLAPTVYTAKHTSDSACVPGVNASAPEYASCLVTSGGWTRPMSEFLKERILWTPRPMQIGNNVQKILDHFRLDTEEEYEAKCDAEDRRRTQSKQTGD